MPSSNVHIAVKPATLRLSLSPGEITTSRIAVQNLADTPQEIRLYAEPFQLDASFQPVFNTPNHFTQVSSWISFDSPSYIFNPGESKTIYFTISPPLAAPGGGQYAAIFAEAVPDSVSDASVATAHRIALLLYTTVAGDIDPVGYVDFLPTFWFQLGNDITLRETHSNTGNIDYEAITNVSLNNLFSGREIRSLTLSSHIVLPETSPTFKSALEDVPLGLYTIRRTQEIFGETYSTDQILLVFPLPFLILSLIILASTIGLLILSRKNRTSKTPALTT